MRRRRAFWTQLTALRSESCHVDPAQEARLIYLTSIACELAPSVLNAGA